MALALQATFAPRDTTLLDAVDRKLDLKLARRFWRRAWTGRWNHSGEALGEKRRLQEVGYDVCEALCWEWSLDWHLGMGRVKHSEAWFLRDWRLWRKLLVMMIMIDADDPALLSNYESTGAR
jgi:hypothetical protein